MKIPAPCEVADFGSEPEERGSIPRGATIAGSADGQSGFEPDDEGSTPSPATRRAPFVIKSIDNGSGILTYEGDWPDASTSFCADDSDVLQGGKQSRADWPTAPGSLVVTGVDRSPGAGVITVREGARREPVIVNRHQRRVMAKKRGKR